jgi:hypothetical protein
MSPVASEYVRIHCELLLLLLLLVALPVELFSWAPMLGIASVQADDDTGDNERAYDK